MSGQNETSDARLDELEREVEALEARVDALSRKLNKQQADHSPDVEFGDWRDRKVISRLAPDETYEKPEIFSLYKQYGEVKKKSKVKERVNLLTGSELMRKVGSFEYRFVGKSE